MKSPTTSWSKTQWLGTRRCNTAGLTTLTWPLCPTRLRTANYWHLIHNHHGLVSTDIRGPTGLTEVGQPSWIGHKVNQTTMVAPFLQVVQQFMVPQGVLLTRNVAIGITSPARENQNNAQSSSWRSALKPTWRILWWNNRFWDRYVCMCKSKSIRILVSYPFTTTSNLKTETSKP